MTNVPDPQFQSYIEHTEALVKERIKVPLDKVLPPQRRQQYWAAHLAFMQNMELARKAQQ